MFDKRHIVSHRRSSLFFIIFTIIAGMAVILQGAYFFHVALTGKATASLSVERSVEGQILDGRLIYSGSKVDILPHDSVVAVSVNSYTKTMLLKDVINKETLGLVERVEFRPYLDIVLGIEDDFIGNGSESVSKPGSGGSDDGYIPYIGDEFGGFFGGEDPPLNGGDPPPANCYLSPPLNCDGSIIFGNVILSDQNDISIRIKKEEDIELQIEPGKRAYVKEARLRGNLIDEGYVQISQSDTSVMLISSYSEYVDGFTLGVNDIVVDFSRFDFLAPPKKALVEAKFIYKGEKLATIHRSITVSSPTIVRSKDFPPVDAKYNYSIQEPDFNYSDSRSPECGIRIVCTSFGACASPSLKEISSGLVTQGLVQSRRCKDEVCRDFYTETQSCSQPSPPVSFSAVSRKSGNESRGASSDIKKDNRFDEKNLRLNKNSFDQDIFIRGSVVRKLSINEQINVFVDGTTHSVGVISLEKNKRARIVVSSERQEAVLEVGETRPFDVNGDGLFDLQVMLHSMSRNRVLLGVAPFNEDSESIFLEDNELALTVYREDIHQPVAHVILDEQLPTLRVLLVQSDNILPTQCYNSIRDSDEESVDCGGESCSSCKPERRDLFFIGSLTFLFAVAFALFTLTRTRQAGVK